MKKRVLGALGVSLVLLAAAPARANDTLAVLGAGGLELATTADIVMVSEDLYLSPSEIRVRYAFRNESDRDITARVAFPLPDIDQGPIANVDLPARDQQNFVDFQILVDGQPVLTKLEQKAIAGDGSDVTSAVAAAGLPANANLPGWQDKVRALPDNAWRQLIQQRLLDYGEGKPDRSDEPGVGWALRATFHWEQTFPAGKTIIVDHRYKPIVGGSIVYSAKQLVDAYGRYCLDDQGKAGAGRLLKQVQAGVRDPENSVGIAASQVSYVLTTGANWKGPIGRFHLTIDKQEPHGVLSLCMSGLKKSGPTTFELERNDFVPRENIDLVIFEPKGK